MRKDRTPSEKGYDFERFWASIFGVKPQPGSGSQWFARMDVATTPILFSCKHTDAESLRVTRGMMKEVQDAISGPGGIGGDAIGAIATNVAGEALVTFRAEDFLRLAQSDEIKFVTPSHGQAKRARAKIPALLRAEDDSAPQ